MNLEGKQQIWNDYQKEIADDRYYYARCCIRQTYFPGSEWAFQDIMNNIIGASGRTIAVPGLTLCISAVNQVKILELRFQQF